MKIMQTESHVLSAATNVLTASKINFFKLISLIFVIGCLATSSGEREYRTI